MAELERVHAVIRNELAVIEQLSAAIAGGAPVPQVQQQLQELSATNLVWTLRTGCLRYCSLVHRHHGGEDGQLFPALRRINPALRPVIATLEADHLTIARYLDAVEAAAQCLGEDAAARDELAAALHGLSDHLLRHLTGEEHALNPTLRRLPGWPLA